MYRNRIALRGANNVSTKITKLLTGGPARVVRNRLVDKLADLEDITLPFPAQEALTGPLGADDDRDYLPLYAGQSVAMTRKMSAAQLMAILVEETESSLKSLSQ